MTDGNTWAGAGMSFNSGASAEKNVTSYDESLFLVHTIGDNTLCLFSFDKASFSATFRACNPTWGPGGGADFGYTAADNRALYTYAAGKLYRMVINTNDWSMSSDPSFNNGKGFFDPDGPECLAGQIAANHWSVNSHALSSDDETVIAAVGSVQDKDEYVVAWSANKGCQWLNARTWQTSSGWNTGLRNPVPISWAGDLHPNGPGGIHNAQIDRSGAYGVLTIHDMGFPQRLFWKIGTNVVDATCKECVSHWACDYGVCFWNHQISTNFGMVDRVIGSQVWTPNMSSGTQRVFGVGEEHASHAYADPVERYPYLVSWDSPLPAITGVWQNELIGVSWDGSQRTVRFNKSWTSGLSFWSTARCSISRQGNYALCGSDYQLYNLDRGFGNGRNADTCDHALTPGVKGNNSCRTDVLLFELR